MEKSNLNFWSNGYIRENHTEGSPIFILSAEWSEWKRHTNQVEGSLHLSKCIKENARVSYNSNFPMSLLLLIFLPPTFFVMRQQHLWPFIRTQLCARAVIWRNTAFNHVFFFLNVWKTPAHPHPLSHTPNPPTSIHPLLSFWALGVERQTLVWIDFPPQAFSNF